MNEKALELKVNEWNRLGQRTFWLFLWRRIEIAGGFLILGIAFSAAATLQSVPSEIIPMLSLAGIVCFTVFLIALVVTILVTYIVYKSHGYFIGDDAIKIKRGILKKEEIAIPYRQIQNVEIERNLNEQMLGLSRIIILTAGQDDPLTKENESQGVLPAMQKEFASLLQTELLKRADIQKVIKA